MGSQRLRTFQRTTIGETGPDSGHEAGITVVEESVASVVTVEGDRVRSVATCGGACHNFDILYFALGSTARSNRPRGLGTVLDENGCVATDERQRGSTDGLLAASGVVRSLDQISVAMGEAAIAATAIHNRPRGGTIPSSSISEALSFSIERHSNQKQRREFNRYASRAARNGWLVRRMHRVGSAYR